MNWKLLVPDFACSSKLHLYFTSAYFPGPIFPDDECTGSCIAEGNRLAWPLVTLLTEKKANVNTQNHTKSCCTGLNNKDNLR